MQESFIHQLIEQLPLDNQFQRKATIIFPTKRACQYFERALLKKLGKSNFWLPEIISIQEFLYQHVPYAIAPDDELLAILYPIQETKTALKQSFVDFYKWGKMMLKDFSEIDQYLVDSKHLFHYVKSLKSIDDDNELTSEQSQLLSQFWDTLPVDETSNLKRNFLKTWESLSEIYDAFRIVLEAKNIAYEGMAYRALLEQLESRKKKFVKRYFMLAGFNALSAFEERLFKHLSENYETKIFWDADEYYLKNRDLEAGLFIRRYQQLFSDKVNHLVETNFGKSQKEVELVVAPLEISQIDYAISLVKHFKANETVIVLCDESLLYPLVNKLPQNIDFNITMGYPLMLHPIQTLLRYILDFKKYRNERKSISSTIFLKIIKHELLARYLNSDKIKLVEQRAVLYGYLDQKIIEEIFEAHNLLEIILSKQKNNQQFLSAFLAYLKVNGEKTQLDDQAVDKTIEAFEALVQSTSFGKINLEEEDLYKLMKQSIAGIKIPFNNASLDGLQIMGFLETRNLDFKNIVIVGATDNHLPGTNKSASFIPFSIRKALNLPTYQENDAIYGYHFYRLLQRAESITIMSANSISGSPSQPSRFIEQIKYEWKQFENISIREHVIDIPLPVELPTALVSIDKNADNIEKKFEAYFQNEKQLSASALNVYVRCPFQFYLKYIAGLKEPEELVEAYDQRILGKIFHKVMELFYQPFLESKEWISSSSLENYYKGLKFDDLLKQAFEIEKIKYSKTTIIGQNVLVRDIILQFMKLLIQKDIASNQDFKIIGLEQKIEDIPLKLENGQTVYMKSYIDRVDLVKDNDGSEYVRIIDYKTGKAAMNNPKTRSAEKPLNEYFSAYFKNDKIKEGLQGYFYAWIYHQKYPNRKLKVGFYSGKQLSKGLLMLRNGETLTDSLLMEFQMHLKLALSEMFNVLIPFTQNEDESAYEYSAYKVLVE